MTTQAEQFAARMGGDGRVWTSPEGLTLERVSAEFNAIVEYGTALNKGCVRYYFPDDSAVVRDMQMGLWALEGDTPWKWNWEEL